MALPNGNIDGMTQPTERHVAEFGETGAFEEFIDFNC
jgi:hypothetical protein